MVLMGETEWNRLYSLIPYITALVAVLALGVWVIGPWWDVRKSEKPKYKTLRVVGKKIRYVPWSPDAPLPAART
jgi:hypothetical protein